MDQVWALSLTKRLLRGWQLIQRVRPLGLNVPMVLIPIGRNVVGIDGMGVI
jgi:hypothetical protein